MNKQVLLAKIRNMGFNYLRISLTKDCNGACSFCHNEGQKIGKRGNAAFPTPTFLSLEEYEYIARFFSGTLKLVSLTGGEPTLAQNIADIVKIFKKQGYIVRMTTNAFLLDEPLQIKLKKAGLDAVNVSLPTLQSDGHAQMFNVKNKLPIVLFNLERLSQNFSGKVKINFMALKENIPHQLLPISNLSARLGITISFLTTLENSTDVSNRVLKYLIENIGIFSKREIDGKFGKKTVYVLKTKVFGSLMILDKKNIDN